MEILSIEEQKCINGGGLTEVTKAILYYTSKAISEFCHPSDYRMTETLMNCI